MEKDKAYYIHQLTLFDTAEHRLRGKVATGKYTREPVNYRNDLFEIYRHLDLEHLKKLVELRGIKQ